jgi:hypothetical protein
MVLRRFSDVTLLKVALFDTLSCQPYHVKFKVGPGVSLTSTLSLHVNPESETGKYFVFDIYRIMYKLTVFKLK